MKIKCELYNDNFQNRKKYNIPRAQLVIADDRRRKRKSNGYFRDFRGGREMKILTDEAEDKLVSIIGTLIVVAVVVLIIGIVGGIESGRMW